MTKEYHDRASLLALICSILALICFAFVLYVGPHIMFGLHYNVPEFISHVEAYLARHHDTEGFLAALLILGPPLIAGIIFAWFARYLTKDELSEDEQYTMAERKRLGSYLKTHEGTRLTLIVGSLIFFVIAALFIIEFLIVWHIEVTR